MVYLFASSCLYNAAALAIMRTGMRAATRAPPKTRAPAKQDALTTHFVKSSILSAAVTVLSRRGIGATRVEDLLLAAGIARRTFYRYFASKEDVLASLYEVSTDELVKSIERAQRDQATPLAGVRQGIDTYLEFHRDIPRALGELIELSMRSESQLAPRRRWLREQLVRLLDEAVQAMDGRRLDLYVYHALVSALEGLSLHLLEGTTTAADLERARSVVHALVDQALGLPTPAPLPQRR